MRDNKKVLIVDDLTENLELYSIFIKNQFPKVEIITTNRSRDTFSIVEREHPDLIMLDAMMPEMDGFEVCAQLKQNPETASILILMVSAVLVDSRNRATGLNAGADGYLCKPFEKQELIAQVQAFFRLRDFEIALQEARRKAELATETKSRFLAQMSHEIRTPMNAVIGMTDIILETELSSEQREMAEIIKKSGESLLRIINDILDFSKIESGKLEIHNQKFSLVNCIEAVISLLAYSAQSKGVELAYWIDPKVPETVFSDYDRLRQVLVNLAGNAVKFTNAGEVFLKVERARDVLVEDDDEDPLILFSVRDTGIGISEENQKLLFDPFTQVDPSNTRKFHGTGLGLAISKRIVTMMGGELMVDSREGHGSTFSFALPLSERPTEEIAHDQASLATIKDKVALIVDDTDINRQILRKLIEGWGLQAEEAASASEALGLLELNPNYDLILLDMQMPVMDGIQLAQKIRRDHRLDKIKIIMLSSVGEHDNTEEFRASDIAACLRKPVRPKMLANTLCRVMSGAKAQKEPAPADLKPDREILAEEYPYRILLAEDNPVNQKVAEKMVAKLGYQLDCVNNGAEAVERIKSEDYDIIFMDMQMPEMDGWEATRVIRNEVAAERQPYIIAMTAGAMHEDREKCFEAGLDAFVPKPIRMNELIGALKAAKTGARYGDEPPH